MRLIVEEGTPSTIGIVVVLSISLLVARLETPRLVVAAEEALSFVIDVAKVLGGNAVNMLDSFIVLEVSMAELVIVGSSVLSPLSELKLGVSEIYGPAVLILSGVPELVTPAELIGTVTLDSSGAPKLDAAVELVGINALDWSSILELAVVPDGRSLTVLVKLILGDSVVVSLVALESASEDVC